MESIKFFESIQHLDPRCPGCGSKLDYGVNTCFDKAKDIEICKGCGSPLE